MMAKQGTSTVVPKLRFPEFRGKDGWQAENLGDICEVLNNRRCPITSKDRVPGPFPYYGASGVVDSVNDYIFDERLLLVGEDGAKWGRFEATAFIAEGKYWVNNHAHVLKSIGIEDSLLESYLTMLDIAPFVTGAAPPKLTLAKLKSIPIPVPASYGEQQKIADCLTSLDEVIDAQRRKVAALKAHKRGLMQQLFPCAGEARPRLRFPEFRNTPEWRACVLGELALIVRGGSPRPIEDFLTHESDGLNWLKIGDVDREAKYVTKTEEKVRAEALSKTRVIQSGDFILSNSMSFGRPYISTIETCIHDGWIAVTNIPDDLSREFLYYSILSARSQKYFVDQAAGSGVQNLNKEIVKLLPLGIPSNEEQQRIADCLSSLDTQITAGSSQLAALKTYKQGLMQQLFPAPDGIGA